MPIYDRGCPNGHHTTIHRSMNNSNKPHHCPTCQQPTQQRYTQPPTISTGAWRYNYHGCTDREWTKKYQDTHKNRPNTIELEKNDY